MSSCPGCSRRLPARVIGFEFPCPRCGARLKANPLAAGLWALVLGGVPGAVLVSIDHSWPWFVGGVFTSILCTYALWCAFFKVERVS
jgi:hypothetical protein